MCPASGANCFNVNGDGAINANSPPGSVGSIVDVKVTVGAVTSATGNADKFSYVAPGAPVVDTVIPGHGTAAGGDGVQITGSGFSGATAVAFGTTTLVPCTPSVFGACFNVNGDNGINATSPPGTASTTVDVTVTAAGFTSATSAFDKFTFDPAGPPVVSGVSPRSGPATGGTGVQINGSGFTGATAVAFGSATLPPCPASGAPCFNVNGDGGIFANSPPGSAGTMVDVTVTVGAVTSATGNADKFSYVAPGAPVVDAVIPGHGTAAGGTDVQITGSGFSGATAVAFGSTTLPPCPASGAACFNPGGDTFIGASSPPGTASTMVDVTVTVGALTSATNGFDKFTYDPQGPPVVSGVSPRSGPATGGTGVLILGSGFTGASAVAFGSTTLPPCPASGAPCFNVNGDSGIFANSPPGSAGTTVNVTVTVGAVTSATGTADKFAYAPTVTVASSSNPSTVGSSVTYTAAVAPTPDGGTVAFTDNAGTLAGCGAVAVNTSTGNATCTTSYSAMGSHAILAIYSGDTNFAASSGSLTQQVNISAAVQAPLKSPAPLGSAAQAPPVSPAPVSPAAQAPPKNSAPGSLAAQSATSPGLRHPAPQPQPAPVIGAVAPSARAHGTQSPASPPQAGSKPATALTGGGGTAWPLYEWIRLSPFSF